MRGACTKAAISSNTTSAESAGSLALATHAITHCATIPLVDRARLGTERLEKMPDRAVCREELTFELTG